MILTALLFLSWSDVLMAGSTELMESEPSSNISGGEGATLEYPAELRERLDYTKHDNTTELPVLLSEQELSEELETFIENSKQETSNHGSN